MHTLISSHSTVSVEPVSMSAYKGQLLWKTVCIELQYNVYFVQETICETNNTDEKVYEFHHCLAK